MNINIPNLKNISLIKIMQENEIPSNPNSQRESTLKKKSLIKDRKLNKSQIKEKSPLNKFTTKTYFENNNKNNKHEKFYANKEMKKNLTHRIFVQNIPNKDTQPNIKNFKLNNVACNDNNNNNKTNNKENKEFKIKVKKIFDLNELTVHNITNDNTTSSNKNKENTAKFEKLVPENFEFSKKNNSISKQAGKNLVKKFNCESAAEEKEEAKVEKYLEKRRSQILQGFPLFKNSFIIEENANNENIPVNFNNMLDIETLPNMKYSEVNSLNESFNDNASSNRSSFYMKKNCDKLLIKIEESEKISEKNLIEDQVDNENEFDSENDDNNLSLEEDSSKINNNINNVRKSGASRIKETFTLFLQNNSKKEFLIENSTNKKDDEDNKDREITRNNLKNSKNIDKINDKYDNKINFNYQNQITRNEKNTKADASRKILGSERNNKNNTNNNNNDIIKKLSNNFNSSQKNSLKFSKTKNHFSSLSKIFNNINNSNSLSELNQKLANCDNILSYIEQNKKLKSEVEILTEKIKTLKKIQQNKTHEIEILKNKYSEAIESYKCEIEKNKNLKEKIQKQNSFIKNLKTNFKILSNNLIEITELLLLSKSSAEKRASLIAAENASFSIDIYDSYNNEDEKNSLLQEQIQSLLIGKFMYFKKQLNLDLDFEIQKIKNWNSNVNFVNGRNFIGNNNNSNNNSNCNISNSNNIEMSISNIKIGAFNKNNENDSFESSKKNVSQDYFDLSISNQFLNLNQVPSGNFGNLSSNINININKNPQFIFNNGNYVNNNNNSNNYNSKQNPHNNSFGAIDGESDNIFGSNSNKNYNSNSINNNNTNNNLNLNNNINPSLNANNNLNNVNNNNNNNNNLTNYSSNKEKNNNSNNRKNNQWTIIFNKEEQMDINNCNWNKLNYNSNNRDDKFKIDRIDSINNLIGANGTNKNLALSSNYNSNSNNIFDSFLQSAKGPNDSFSNSANDSILQIVNFNNNPNCEKESKKANKSNKQLQEVELLNDFANDSLGKISSNQINLKEQISKIQNDSCNFIFEESKAKSENYNSDNESKRKFICDELVNNYGNNNNIEIESFKDNLSEKNDGNKLKRMFSFEV